MKRTESQLIAFKVQQAVGSMAIEGIRVSRQSQADMMRVATGRVSAESVKAALKAKYQQTPAN